MRTKWFGGLCVLVASTLAAVSYAQEYTSSALSLSQAQAVRAIENNAPQYSWDIFRALNTPTNSLQIPKVWEYWRPTSTTFLKDGTRPPGWGQSIPLPAEVQKKLSQLPNWPASPIPHNLDATIQVDGLVLRNKWNQIVRYQLLMNRPAFEYVLSEGFYNVDGQQAAAIAGKPADFPWNAYELKTSWIWIGTNQEIFDALNGKYYMVRAYYEQEDRDGNSLGWEVGFAAFAGMHIINKSLPTWVWITFENVFNDQYTQAKLELPIAPEDQAANSRNQRELADSVFANYELAGTQITFVDAKYNPTLLANSTIESAFQKRSSCITCHAISSINRQGSYFNLVDSSGGNVSYYVGVPPDYREQGYTSLDFVWSLKRAHRLKR